MSEPAFLEMRAGLVERGLLCGETYSLTPAGHDYAREVLAQLYGASAPPPPVKAPVRWDTRRVAHRATTVTADA